MNRKRSHTVRNSTLLLMAVLLAGILAACTVEPEKAPAIPDETTVTSFEVTPLAAGKSPDEALYLVEIGLSTVPGVLPPPAIQLLTRDRVGKDYRHRVLDTGTNGDKKAGDRIWSAIIPGDQIPFDEDGAPGKTAGWKFSCDIKLVGPGQECESWGTCPEESLLGGPTWFCYCFEKCTIKYE